MNDDEGWTKEELVEHEKWAIRHNELQGAIYNLMELGVPGQSIMEYTEQFIQDGLYDIENLSDEYIAANEKPFIVA